MRKFYSRLALLPLLLCPVLAHAVSCPTGYSFSKTFTISAQSSTLTAFPVALPFNGIARAGNFTLSDLKGTASGGQIQSSSGFDIVFCDAATSGNLLNFERVNYDTTSGAVTFWVGRTLSSASSTVFYMFYGKSGDTDHSNAAALWSAANYVFVQHYGTSSALSVTDSTANTTPVNHGATATSGVVGGGTAVASASSQYIDAGSSVNVTSVTVELWANATSFSGCQRIVSNLTGSNFNGYELYMGSPGCASNGNITLQSGNANALHSTAWNSNSVTTGNWYYFTATQTGTTQAGYQNGAVLTANNLTGSNTIGTSPVDLNVGRWSGGASNYFNGSLDEVRIANIAQSATWIAANYATQSSANTFATMGGTGTVTQPNVSVIF